MPMSRDDFEAKLIARANEDQAFRQALLANPKATLQKELQEIHAGVTLPENLQVSVVEETATHIYLRLPIQRSGQLSEQELAGVAGGASPPTVEANVIVAAVVTPVSIDVTAVVTPGVVSNLQVVVM